MTTITLPYPPSVNELYRPYRNRVLLSRKGRAYKQHAQMLLNGMDIDMVPLPKDVRVVMRLYRPRRIGDLANYEKITWDVLEGYAYENDRQIADKHCLRFDDKDNPRIEIEVEAI